jgi:hypothetical protein
MKVEEIAEAVTKLPPDHELLLACCQGIMAACDRVAFDRGMVFDTPIYNYSATCGGRLNIVAARRLSAQILQNGSEGPAPTSLSRSKCRSSDCE